MKNTPRGIKAKGNKGLGETSLTIARAILDLGRPVHSQSQISQVANAYLENPRAYMGRLMGIIEKAVEEKVHLLLLPENALVWRNANQLKSYKNAARNIPWVVGGQVHIPKEGRGKEFSVDTVAWYNGKMLDFVDANTIHWLLGGRGFSVVATPVTIKRVAAGSVSNSSRIRQLSETGVIVLGMKVSDYAPARLRPLMSVMQSHRKHPRKMAVIQSFWKPGNSGFKIHWMSPGRKAGFLFHRHSIPHETGDGRDFLDIIRFNGLKVNIPPE